MKGDFNMKIVRDGKELIGKTIAFIHMAQFAENITIATEDECVLVVRQTFDEDTEDSQIDILSEARALRYIENNTYVRDTLGELGIFDIAAYRKKQLEERAIKEKEYKARKLKEERELYEKLKAKFEK